MTEPTIIWQPTPRQSEFLAASEDEVLYGGAAGGGKTDALVIDALGAQYKSIEQPEYRALILRRTYAELKEVIDRTNAIYPQIYRGAKFNTQDGDWRFPSGARIEFSYLERDSDVMKYQSRQFQWVGWEELAQWPSPWPYEYMMSRLRAPERLRIPCVIRATCNPDGPGAKWLAKRFGINPNGESSRINIEVNGKVWRRRFIASKLDDNPHLSGTGYREKLMMLPEETKRALLLGRWDEPTIPNAIYAREMLALADSGRIRQMPYDPRFPVHTVWDLGWNDAMTIGMIQKPTHNSISIINYIEDRFKRYDELIKDLNELGYVWGTDWIPPDGRNENPQTGMSAEALLKGLGRKVEVIPVSVRGDVEYGIKAVRMLLPNVFIDNTERKRPTGHLGCARMMDCMRRYRRNVPRATNEPSEPVHDEYSHACDMMRYLAVIAHMIVNPSEIILPPPVPQFESHIPGMGMLG